METVNNDANESTVIDGNQTDAGGDSSNPQIDNAHFDPDSENLIDTVENREEVGGVDIASGGARDQGQAEDTKAGEGAAQETKPAEEEVKPDSDIPGEYHKDPAWQRIIKERDAALKSVDDLSQRVGALEKPAESTEVEPTVNFVDPETLSEEELAEWQNDDPKGFTANLIKHTAHIVREDLRREGNEVAEAAKVDKTYDAYEKANPDTDGKTGFKQMWASGEIQSYMAEHLGHNPISAHMSMVAEAKASAAEATTQKRITEAVEKAKKEFVTMNRAREVTDGLGGGPGYTPRDGNDELKNTKERGGFVNVVAQKLARSRRNATQ